MWTKPIATSGANGQPSHQQLPEYNVYSPSISTVPLASTAPPDHQPSWEDYTELAQRPRNATVPVSAPPPHRIPVSECQWADELVGHLLGLPPRSNFGGKFSIIADPDVDNAMRAQIFADQLRSQGVPIPERHFASRTQGPMRVHTLLYPCSCEDGCPGRFLVSVGDDITHSYGVPGQRIGVALYHPTSG